MPKEPLIRLVEDGESMQAIKTLGKREVRLGWIVAMLKVHKGFQEVMELPKAEVGICLMEIGDQRKASTKD